MFTIPILTYHKVTTKKEFGINNISPDRFETQIRTIIESGYTPITFKMLLKNDEKIPEKPIIITFDDGKIIVKHLHPTDNSELDRFEGKTAKEIYTRISEKGGPLDASHLMYLGSELGKAEMCIKKNMPYLQDED